MDSGVRAVEATRLGRFGRYGWNAAIAAIKPGDFGDDLPGHAQAVGAVVSRHVVGDSQKNGASALGLQRMLGLGSHKAAWTWLQKLRRAMVRPRRDRLTGGIEVDETFVGGLEEGVRGRKTETKAPVIIAAQEYRAVIEQIGMRRVTDASAPSLESLIGENIARGGGFMRMAGLVRVAWQPRLRSQGHGAHTQKAAGVRN